MWDIDNFKHSCKIGWLVVEYHAPSQWTIWKYHDNLYWIFLHPVYFWRELLIWGNERNQYEFPSSMKGATDMMQSNQFFSSHIQCEFHNILRPPFSVVIFFFLLWKWSKKLYFEMWYPLYKAYMKIWVCIWIAWFILFVWSLCLLATICWSETTTLSL